MKLLWILLFLTTLSCSQNLSYTSVCFSSSQHAFCKEGNHTIIDISSPKDIAGRILFIQQTIRQTLERNTTKNLVLLAEGFDGTLLFIAQHNLLRFYRKDIKGIVLKNAFANLYQTCMLDKSVKHHELCHKMNDFHAQVKGKASKEEIFKALSPALQMDWYERKVLIVDADKEEQVLWEKAFYENAVPHSFVSKPKVFSLSTYFPLKKSFKIQPKKALEKRPRYFGPILSFHVGKIVYHSYHTLTKEENIAYGTNTLQTYDRFYDKNVSQKRPLFIYVHGGGWQGGDKQYFAALCQQYADKGYMAIALNYRLLALPQISIEMMVEDITMALEDILSKSKIYHFDTEKVSVMGDSSGSQLLFMAISKLSSPTAIQKAIFNTIPSNFMLYSAKKREKLTGEKDTKRQEEILKPLSPLFNLMYYHPQTLVIQVLDDAVVKAKHLALLEIQSVINYDNIRSLWIEHGVHPSAPKERSLAPNYSDISRSIEAFLAQ